MKLSSVYINQVIKNALLEDHTKNDVTSHSLFPKSAMISAHILVKEQTVLAGIDIAKKVFHTINPKIVCKAMVKDGMGIKKNTSIMKINGSARDIFTAERTALNFLGHLSGIATATHEFVVQAKQVKIYDTRKTLPGVRLLQKYAVSVGGGCNHRMDLEEHFLIKDNHINTVKTLFPDLELKDIVKTARKYRRNKKIEIEVESIAQFKEVLCECPEIIMLDNMSVAQIKQAVKLRNELFQTKKRPLLEVSGNVTKTSIKKYASLGIDRISIGCLTHSVKNIDFSLEIL